MSTITRYVLVNKFDVEDDVEYLHLNEAIAAAQEKANTPSAVIARTYVYDDSELVWTPDGSDIWPPAEEGA